MDYAVDFEGKWEFLDKRKRQNNARVNWWSRSYYARSHNGRFQCGVPKPIGTLQCAANRSTASKGVYYRTRGQLFQEERGMLSLYQANQTIPKSRTHCQSRFRSCDALGSPSSDFVFEKIKDDWICAYNLVENAPRSLVAVNTNGNDILPSWPNTAWNYLYR